jgi:predicted secreted protein
VFAGAAACSSGKPAPSPSASAPATPEATGNKTVTITEKDNGLDQMLRTGDTLVVLLRSIAGTGYRWAFVSPPDPAVLAVIGDEDVAPTSAPPDVPPRLGAPGVHRYTLLAKAPGVTQVKLVHKPPGRQTPAPLDYYVVNVKVS